MFKKVLISDDYSSINQGVLAVLEQTGIHNIKQVKYCDDAYLEIKSAILNKEPYDLFITDLNFKTDHRNQKYPSGEVLTAQLKQEYPDFPIIVYSVEDRLQKVRHLVSTTKINAFVCKGRDGLNDLSKAIQSVYNNTLFLSSNVKQSLSSKNNMAIDDYDLQLLTLIATGNSKNSISKIFIDNAISPSSISSIEKKQAKLIDQFKANNAIHLISIVKDLGII